MLSRQVNRSSGGPSGCKSSHTTRENDISASFWRLCWSGQKRLTMVGLEFATSTNAGHSQARRRRWTESMSTTRLC